MTTSNSEPVDETLLKDWYQEHVAQFRWKAVTGKRRVAPVILGYRLSSSSFVLLLNRKEVFFESRDTEQAVRVYESLSLDEGAYIVATEAGPVMGFAEHVQAIAAAKLLVKEYGELCILYFNRTLEKVRTSGCVEVVGTLAGFFTPRKED